VAVRPGALPVVVLDAVSRADTDRSVTADVEGALAGIRQQAVRRSLQCSLGHIPIFFGYY
jgi:hypothetical protein